MSDEIIDLIESRLHVAKKMFVNEITRNLYSNSTLMKAILDGPQVPSLSSMITDALAVETDPVKLRKQANLNWASIGRKRFERPGGL